MDSKLAEERIETQLEIASNIWIKRDGEEPSPWEAVEWVPGDLRVSFSDVGRDRLIIQKVLNPRQIKELTAYRFFLKFGQTIDFYDLPEHPRG